MNLFGFEIRRAGGGAGGRVVDGLPARAERRVVQGNGTGWLSGLLQMFSSEARGAAGEVVTEDRALTIGAVYTALRIIAGTVSSLPLHVMRRTERGREFALRHWAYPLLHDSPNEFHTTSTWLSTVVAHRLLWGNAYNRIEWLANGAAGALLPLMPWETMPRRVKSNERVWLGVRFAEPGELVYQHDTEAGREYFAADEIVHVPGLGYDGVRGLSVIRYMADTLGTAKAMERFTGAFFRNGAKPGAILEVPGTMNETAQQNLAGSLREEFGNPDDAFKVLVLEQGAKLHTYTMPLEDAQLLDARKLSRSEIFGLYGVPPHLGGDTERSTSWGTGIEQQDIGYAKHTITPLIVGIEQELNRKLFGRGSAVYAKFNLAALERGDFKSRMEGYRFAVGGPFLTREEARDLEDWNATGEPGADKLLTPLNMGVGATPEKPEPKPAPAASAMAVGDGDEGNKQPAAPASEGN